MKDLKLLERKNFKPEEFWQSDVAEKLEIDNTPPKNLIKNGIRVANMMQTLRDLIKFPIIITSGYRNKEVNKLVGGSPTSKHMQFLAVDFKTKEYSPEKIVKFLKEIDFNCDLCLVENGWIHIQLAEKHNLDNRKLFGYWLKKKDNRYYFKKL